MDFITWLPKTQDGFDAIAVFCDRLTKMVHLARCNSDVTAEQTADLFFDNVFKLHGIPENVVSDRGTQFTSKFWRELMQKLGTELRMSTAYHPETDGQTERTNRTLEQYLRHYTSAAQDDWNKYLASAEYCLNASWQESVKTTPFVLNFGEQPRAPLTVPRDYKVPAVQRWHGRLQKTLQVAKQALQAAQNRQKAYADTKRRELSFSAGDWVLLNTKNIRIKGPPDGARKLTPRWIGPFKILAKVGKVAYRLEFPESMNRIHSVFHVSLMKPYKSDGRVQPPPPILEVEGEVLWEFERILDHRKHGHDKQYLVKWKGYGHEHNSWEPESSFEHCTAELEQYWQEVQARTSTSRVRTAGASSPSGAVNQQELEKHAVGIPLRQRNQSSRNKRKRHQSKALARTPNSGNVHKPQRQNRRSGPAQKCASHKRKQ